MKTSIAFIAVAVAAMAPSLSLAQQLIDAPGQGYREQAGTQGKGFGFERPGKDFERPTEVWIHTSIESLRLIRQSFEFQRMMKGDAIRSGGSATPFTKEWFEQMSRGEEPPVPLEPPARKVEEPPRLRLGEPIPLKRGNP